MLNRFSLFQVISNAGALVCACVFTVVILSAPTAAAQAGKAPSVAEGTKSAEDAAAKAEAPAEPYRQPWRDAKNDSDIVNHDKNSAVFVGAGLGFGQSRASKSGTTPDLAFKAFFEPGYQKQLSAWSRMELSGELFFGSTGFRKGGDEGYKARIPVGLGLLAKAGYGFSLGSNMFGTWKVGLGPVMAKYTADGAGDVEIESKSSIWGTAGYLGFSLAVPMTDSLDFNGGVELTHMAFDIGDVRVKSGGNTVTDDYGSSLVMNVWQATLGVRLKL